MARGSVRFLAEILSLWCIVTLLHVFQGLRLAGADIKISALRVFLGGVPRMFDFLSIFYITEIYIYST